MTITNADNQQGKEPRQWFKIDSSHPPSLSQLLEPTSSKVSVSMFIFHFRTKSIQVPLLPCFDHFPLGQISASEWFVAFEVKTTKKNSQPSTERSQLKQKAKCKVAHLSANFWNYEIKQKNILAIQVTLMNNPNKLTQRKESRQITVKFYWKMKLNCKLCDI